jgi:DNA (cytosine-5)-methyltransferase 1
MEITVGSLFSGIGGLDLGLERAGMKVIWQSEIDKYCCKILKKHWPEVLNHGNIKEINWQEIQRPNIIAGGYPCQPFSTAGKRKGTQDPRHLWPWVREAISQLRPDYAILENVPGHLTMGGIEVIGALTEIGYDAEWRVLSAAGLGANHLRKRIIIVAYPNSQRPHRTEIDTTDREQSAQPEFASCCQTLADTNSSWRCQQCQRQISQFDIGRCSQKMADTQNKRCKTRGQQFRTQSKYPVFADRSTHQSWDYLATNWQIEPNVGRVADGISNRVDRLRGLGNAVVPQVAEYIGRLVMEQYK